MKFTAKRLELIPTKPGCWKYSRIGIFQDDVQIGEYQRNYESFFNTFHPFKLGDEWFALYSRDYTSTRVMKLPSCEDLGGEEPASFGFCPTDYYVPELTGQILNPNDPEPKQRWRDKKFVKETLSEKGYKIWYYPTDKNGYTHLLDEYKQLQKEDKVIWDEWMKRNPILTQHANWGFVGGCVWGGPYEIMFLDLTKAKEGIITRDARFGYIEFSGNIPLKDMISTDGIDVIGAPFEDMRISIAVPTTYSLTGKKLE